MSQVREAIDAALDSEDPRPSSGGFFMGRGSDRRSAHSAEKLRRVLRRILENVDGDLTVNEVLEQLDGMEEE